MSDRLLTPPPDDRACYHCIASSNWDTQTVGRESPNRSFVVLGRQPVGQCRAAPATIDLRAYGESNAVWPIVRATDWYRSFARRPPNIATAERQPGGHPNEVGRPRA